MSQAPMSIRAEIFFGIVVAGCAGCVKITKDVESAFSEARPNENNHFDPSGQSSFRPAKEPPKDANGKDVAPPAPPDAGAPQPTDIDGGIS